MTHYILQYHYGVVDHYADGNRKRRKRNDVDGAIGYEQVDESTDKRYRYRQYDDKSCTPPAEEKHHYQRHKYESEHYRLRQTVDRVLYSLSTVVDDLCFYIGRQTRHYVFGHHLFYLFDDCHRIGSRLLHYHHTYTVLTVDSFVQIDVAYGVAYISQVFDKYVFTQSVGYYYVVYLRALDVFALHAQLILLFAHFYRA